MGLPPMVYEPMILAHDIHLRWRLCKGLTHYNINCLKQPNLVDLDRLPKVNEDISLWMVFPIRGFRGILLVLILCLLLLFLTSLDAPNFNIWY
jgi:hypothetical protein